MPSKDIGPGAPEMFADLLSPEMAAVVPDVAATIDDVEERDISTIREDAERTLVRAGVMNFTPLDVSRIALAARLQRFQERE